MLKKMIIGIVELAIAIVLYYAEGAVTSNIDWLSSFIAFEMNDVVFAIMIFAIMIFNWELSKKIVKKVVKRIGR